MEEIEKKIEELKQLVIKEKGSLLLIAGNVDTETNHVTSIGQVVGYKLHLDLIITDVWERDNVVKKIIAPAKSDGG